VICKVHGFAVAGGSDIALCADTIVMADDAEIGLHADPRVGVPDDGDVGLSDRAGAGENGCCFTGGQDQGSRSGEARTGAEIGPPRRSLTPKWEALAERMAGVPVNQLMMQKLMVNQAIEAMGLKTTQMIATIFRRNHPPLAGGFEFQASRRTGGLEGSRPEIATRAPGIGREPVDQSQALESCVKTALMQRRSGRMPRMVLAPGDPRVRARQDALRDARRQVIIDRRPPRVSSRVGLEGASIRMNRCGGGLHHRPPSIHGSPARRRSMRPFSPNRWIVWRHSSPGE